MLIEKYAFYKKCGIKIERKLAKRFVYPDPRAYKDTDPNCIYINGKDNLMKQILLHPKEKVKIPISRW